MSIINRDKKKLYNSSKIICNLQELIEIAKNKTSIRSKEKYMISEKKRISVDKKTKNTNLEKKHFEINFKQINTKLSELQQNSNIAREDIFHENPQKVKIYINSINCIILNDIQLIAKIHIKFSDIILNEIKSIQYLT